MKKIAMAALAASIGVGAIAASASSATAGGRGYYGGPYYGAGVGFAAGTVFGFAAGAWAAGPRYYPYTYYGQPSYVPPPAYYAPAPRYYYRAPPPPPAYRYNTGSLSKKHIKFCRNKYRSYNARTDTYLGYDGRYHRCVAPY